jgi:perosamine synthetase
MDNNLQPNQLNTHKLVEKLKSMYPKNKEFIALHEPLFVGNEWDYVKECIDTRWVSSVGKFVDQFEKQLTDFTGVKYAIATVNGTAALHLCLQLVGVEEGDEVLLPALTFIATANAVSYCGAIPHFIDSEERTLGIDPHKLQDYLREIGEMRSEGCFNKITGRRIKAIVPMHAFGHPVDLDPLVEICAHFKLQLVEDAAESLGSYYKGKHTGHFGQVSALSFNGNKIITTGGGGAILSNDQTLATRAKHLSTTAKIPHKWEFNHDHIGYNYRLPNLNAALGCAQLENLPIYIEKKRALAKQYGEMLEGIKGIQFFKEKEFARSNYWLNVLLLDQGYENQRDQILSLTNENGIMTRPAWTLLNKLDIYKGSPCMDLKTAESLEGRIINIPSSVFLSD